MVPKTSIATTTKIGPCPSDGRIASTTSSALAQTVKNRALAIAMVVAQTLLIACTLPVAILAGLTLVVLGDGRAVQNFVTFRPARELWNKHLQKPPPPVCRPLPSTTPPLPPGTGSSPKPQAQSMPPVLPPLTPDGPRPKDGAILHREIWNQFIAYDSGKQPIGGTSSAVDAQQKILARYHLRAFDVGAGAHEIHREYNCTLENGQVFHEVHDDATYTCFLRAAMAGAAAKWGGDFHPKACKTSPIPNGTERPNMAYSDAAMGSITVDGEQLTLRQLRKRMAEGLIEFAEHAEDEEVDALDSYYSGPSRSPKENAIAYAKENLWNVDLPGDEGKIEGVFLADASAGFALSLVLKKPILIFSKDGLIAFNLKNFTSPRYHSTYWNIDSGKNAEILEKIMAEDPLVICHNGASRGFGHFLAVLHDPDAPDMGAQTAAGRVAA
jgi:hypothetical protein